MWLLKRIIYLSIILIAIIIAHRKRMGLEKNLCELRKLIIIVFYVETAAVIFAYLFKQTSWLYALFGIVQVYFISSVYQQTFINRSAKKIAGVLLILCLLFMLVTAIINKAWVQVNPEGSTLKSFYVILLCLLLFKDWLQFPTTNNIVKEPMFWVNVGFFFFFSINIFFWIGYNFFAVEDISILKELEPVQYFSNLFLYGNILYAFAIKKNAMTEEPFYENNRTV